MDYDLETLESLSLEELKNLASIIVIDTDVTDLPTRAEVMDVLLRHAR